MGLMVKGALHGCASRDGEVTRGNVFRQTTVHLFAAKSHPVAVLEPTLKKKTLPNVVIRKDRTAVFCIGSSTESVELSQALEELRAAGSECGFVMIVDASKSEKIVHFAHEQGFHYEPKADSRLAEVIPNIWQLASKKHTHSGEL